MIGQTRFDDPWTLIGEFSFPNGVRPWAMVPDSRGHLFGLDARKSEFVLIDYSASGELGRDENDFVAAPIPGLEQFDGQIVVRVAAMPCLGDASGDCLVDLMDLVSVLSNYGQSLAEEIWIGDANADQTVDLQDVIAVASNYGAACQ